MKDTIYREDAIKAVEECLKLLARPRYTVKTAIEAIPSVDVDISEYSDKLWKNAYERGKADRPQEWIPCSERLPEEEGIYLVTATNCVFNTEEIAVGTCYFNIEYGFSNNRKILAWMPLPNPWKGADDEDN